MELPDFHHEEILKYLPLAERSGQNFARRRGKKNIQYIDECVAEAWYWLVVLFNEHYEEISRHDNIEAFLRQKIGYKLFEYWCPYATSTASYLKKKGKHLANEVQITEGCKVSSNSDIDVVICFDAVIRTDLERKIHDLFVQDNSDIEIALALKISEKRVRKILARIKKRLKNYNADIPAVS